MTEMIGGHDVRALHDALSLIRKCQYQETAIEYLTSPEVHLPLGVFAALLDLHDPAKLAELMQAALLRCGLDITCYDSEDGVAVARSNVPTLRLTMPAARSLLLSILESDRKPETVLRLMERA